MLRINQLYFSRDDKTYFHGFTFVLPKGELLQVSGENGIGKTTLLRLIAGFVPPERGTIQVKGRIGYIGHQPGFSADLTVEENLRFIAHLYQSPLSKISLLLEQFALARYANKLAVYLSAGQKRRLAWASLLLMQAELWLLDEPFTALDAAGTAFIKQLIENYLFIQGSVVLTTHQPIAWHSAAVHYLQLEEK